MSIYEYDAEKHIRMERADARADGIAEGLAQGRIEGAKLEREKLLIEKVKKKLDKNKSIEEIADDLEEDVSVIQQIISTLDK